MWERKTMLDFAVEIWTLLRQSGADFVVATAVIVLLMCLLLTGKEYGKRAFARIFHRRNWPHAQLVVIFTGIIVISVRVGIVQRVPAALRTALFLVYLLYVLTVCHSIRRTTWPAERYAKKIQPLLQAGKYLECRSLLASCPWYLQDFDERLEYELMKGKCLFGLGSLKEAYEIYEQIDLRRLYPNEQTRVLVAQIYTLMQLGNLPKAEAAVDQLKSVDPVAAGAMRSFLSELSGHMDNAYRYAADTENNIPAGYEDHTQLFNLHQQMARICQMKNNASEAKVYYRKAFAESQHFHDLDVLGALYENYVTVLHQLDPGCDEEAQVFQKYTESIRNAGVNNVISYCNFSLARARARGDREQICQCIQSTYRTVHTMLAPPEQYLIEVSVLNVMNSEGIYSQAVLNDIQEHFEDYFRAPMPMRVKLLQGLSLPKICTQEELGHFMAWGERLSEYAQRQAREDLDAYERLLPPDYVYERCWVNRPRIDFERRGKLDYDADYVLRLLRDNIRTLSDYGNVLAAADEEAHLADILFELIEMGKLPDDAKTRALILRAIDEGTDYAEKAAMPLSIKVRVDLALYAVRLDQKERVERLIRSAVEQDLFTPENLRRMPEVSSKWKDVKAYLESNAGSSSM